MAKEPTETKCPNCLGPAVMEGSEITCENCDAVFTIKKTGAARVKQIGRIESLEDRVGRLEQYAGRPSMTPELQEANEPPAEPVEPEEPEESGDSFLPAR